MNCNMKIIYVGDRKILEEDVKHWFREREEKEPLFLLLMEHSILPPHENEEKEDRFMSQNNSIKILSMRSAKRLEEDAVRWFREGEEKFITDVQFRTSTTYDLDEHRDVTVYSLMVRYYAKPPQERFA